MRGLEVLVEALCAECDARLHPSNLPEPLRRRRVRLELDGHRLGVALLQPVEGLHLGLGLRLDCGKKIEKLRPTWLKI